MFGETDLKVSSDPAGVWDPVYGGGGGYATDSTGSAFHPLASRGAWMPFRGARPLK